MTGGPLLFAAAFLGAYAGFLLHIPACYAVLLAAVFAIIALFGQISLVRAISLLAFIFSLSLSLALDNYARYHSIQTKVPTGIVVYEGSLRSLEKSLLGTQKGVFDTTGYMKDGKGFPFVARMQVSFVEEAALLELQPNTQLRIRAEVKDFAPALFPGDYNAKQMAMVNDIHGKITVKNPLFIAALEKHSSFFSFARWRHSLRENLLFLTTPHNTANLVALIDGETSLLSEEQRSIYQEVGAGHLLAISGLQISLLALGLFKLLHIILLFVPYIGRLSYARPLAAFLALVLVWLFTAFCGVSPSAVRAASMASVMLLGILLLYENSLVDAFCLAGLFHILLMPSCVIGASFLLSYGAILGLLLCMSQYKSPSRLVPILLSSLAASLLTFPITLHLFGQIAPAGILANIVLVPIAAILQVPAIVGAALGALFHSRWLVELAAFCAGILESLCDAIGSLIGGIYYLQNPSAIATLLLLLASAFFLLAILHRRHLVFLSLSLLLFATAFSPLLFSPKGLRVTVLAVGQGDSTVVEFPSKHTMLIDGGGAFASDFDPGKRIVSRFLSRRGIRKIDVMVVTHPDADHIMGLFYIAEKFPVGEIWTNGYGQEHPLMQRLLNIAAQKNIPVQNPDTLRKVYQFGASSVRILGPDAEKSCHHVCDFSTNNNSLVLLIEHEGKKALWPGDIEEEAERRIMSHHLLHKIDVLKAAHHGSKTSSSQEFVNATHAKHVIFSTGIDNRFHHPHADIVKRWCKSKAIIYNTAMHGEITLWLRKDALHITSFRQAEDTCRLPALALW